MRTVCNIGTYYISMCNSVINDNVNTITLYKIICAVN